MKLQLVFDNSNDLIEFDVIYNHDILQYFVDMSDKNNCNQFSDEQKVFNTVSQLTTELHTAVTLTNSVVQPLCGLNFAENSDLVDYFDQRFLNQQHEHWVFSQNHVIDIDSLRFSQNKETSQLGWKLHEMYPDEIRKIRLAEAVTKLGYIFPYEEVNMTVHRLESFFAQDVEFKSKDKWQVFDNPFKNNMVSNNDVVNFSFGYTYVGRQYYDKWQRWDTDLEFKDHYNYETLEFAFQMNLDRPQTVPYSQEFLSWCQNHAIPPVCCQIPIGNVIDLEKNLKHYRTILYRNSKQANQARLVVV